MRITIQVDLNIEGIRSTLGGEFNLRYNESIPQFAYNWIKQIKKDTGYRNTIIEKVTLNGTDDITDKVKAIEEAPIHDLDFLW